MARRRAGVGLSVVSLIACLAACGGSIDTSLGADRSSATAGEGEPASSGDVGSAGPSGPACALATPVRQDFEDGFTDDWGAGNLGALQFDDVDPISGKRSLKIDLGSPFVAPQKRAIFTRDVAPSCAVKLALKVRASTLFSGQVTIVRLRTLPAWLSLVLGENGAVSFVEEALYDQRADHPVGILSANTPTSIEVDIDLANRRISASLAPVGEALPPPTSSTLLFEHGADVSGVVLGLWAATTSTGAYWLDDFSLE